MKARTAVRFVDDTNIIPDGNAGMGRLLWDLQNPRDPDRDGPPLLDRGFAFIDVGVSRAKVAAALKTLLAGELGFLYGGQGIEFSDPRLDAALAPAVREIEAGIDLELKRDGEPSEPEPSWDAYRIERNALEAGLARVGISLQQADVPHRMSRRQNVLFLGNALNHHPQEGRAHELARIAGNMEEGIS